MKKLYILAIAFIQMHTSIAQQIDSTKKEISLEEVVISASNISQSKKNIVQKIDVLTSKTIADANTQNIGDLLLNTGKIFVQKSQQGGSSPVIRGFEASRVLLVIDGVRMNNAIYRSGHVQNAITTDQNSLSRVEVMYGPSSTIYGSDALGGIVHLITKAPILSSTTNTLVVGTGFVRHNTSNNEKTIHVDASIGNKKIAWMQLYNFSDFGDMKMGDSYNRKYPNFGRRSTYVATINGIDTLLINEEDRVQKFSGYKQWDITQKILYNPSNKISHSLNLQISNSNNVPRYDRLQDTRNFGGSIGTTLRFAQWYYGPQKRVMGAYTFDANTKGFFNSIKANINYQAIEESRQTREFKRYDRFESRIEKVNVFGTTLNAIKKWTNNELTVGLDMQLNDVKSAATLKNLNTGVVSKLDTRYPDGKNTLNNFGVYAQHTHHFNNKKLILNDGIRLQAVRLKSNVLDNSFFNLPDTAITQTNFAVTGNIGLVYNHTKNTSIKLAISSAFRAPNIDDLAKVFESSTLASQVVVPNAAIKPEYTYNIDISFMQKIDNKITFEFTSFYNLFRNAILKAPYTLNGKDSILYNGVKSQVLANQNINKANVYGFSVGVDAEVIKNLIIRSTLTYTKGYFITDNTKNSSIYEKQTNGSYSLVSKKVGRKPLDHIPPTLGKTSITYQYKKINAEFYLLYNGWKKLDEYNADGEDNAQYATADGMPSWLTTNIKTTITAKKGFQVQLGVENFFDRNYRYFASGFSAPGRSFIIALRSNF